MHPEFEPAFVQMNQTVSSVAAIFGFLSLLLWLLLLALFLIPLWRMAHAQQQIAARFEAHENSLSRMVHQLQKLNDAAQVIASFQKSQGNGPGGHNP
jgi:ABC-type multidrug transport system fused ATPase/permease subunit